MNCRFVSMISAIILIFPLNTIAQERTVVPSRPSRSIIRNGGVISIPRPEVVYPSNACISKPDLIIMEQQTHDWDSVKHECSIKATIKNIGQATTLHPFVVIFNDLNDNKKVYYSTKCEVLLPGQECNVEFILPYWIFHPDADYIIDSDFGNLIDECKENNNSTEYHNIG